MEYFENYGVIPPENSRPIWGKDNPTEDEIVSSFKGIFKIQKDTPKFIAILSFCRIEKLHDPSQEACKLIRSWIMGDNKKLRAVGAVVLMDFWQDLRDFKNTSEEITNGMHRLGVLSKIKI